MKHFREVFNLIITNVDLNKEVAILLASIEEENKHKNVYCYDTKANEIKIDDALHRIADIRY